MTDGLRKSHLRKAHQVGLSEVGLPDIYHPHHWYHHLPASLAASQTKSASKPDSKKECVHHIVIGAPLTEGRVLLLRRLFAQVAFFEYS